MFSRSVIPLTFAAVLILSAPASAATGAAGPSPTPLILEVALAVVASIALALRRPAARIAAATRRKITPGARRQAASARARGV